MIPRRIHRLWLGGEEPEWSARFAASWQVPGWELRQWDDEAVAELMPLVNQDAYDRAEAIAPDHAGQLRADIVRYEILHRLGGIYVDADLELLRDELLARVEPSECFAAMEVDGHWIGNTLIGAEAGHPFIKRLIAGLAGSIMARPGQRPARTTGPQYVTRVASTSRTAAGLTLLPQARVYPFGWAEVERYEPGRTDAAERWPEAYTVHWWRNQRRERGILPEAA